MEPAHSPGAAPRRVLLLEPWLGGSHRAFAETWAALSRHAVEVIGLKPRHWRWRKDAGAWELARRLAGREPPDLLVVSDYVDLPRLLGFLPGAWGGVRTLAYFHENQLTYSPATGPVPEDPAAAFADVLTAVRSDVLVFNSAFHRDDFARAADAFLRTLPRPNPRAELATAVAAAHVVAPAPRLEEVPRGAGGTGPLRVLFPHRLEPDKDPAAFARAIRRAAEAHGARLEVVLTGGDPGAARGAAREALTLLEPYLVAAGHVPRAEYLARLAGADVVVSTARHEFFGVAVAEAMAARCTPLLPHRLSYPGLLEDWRAGRTGGGTYRGDEAELAERLAGCAGTLDALRTDAARAAARDAVLRFDAAACVATLDGLG